LWRRLRRQRCSKRSHRSSGHSGQSQPGRPGPPVGSAAAPAASQDSTVAAPVEQRSLCPRTGWTERALAAVEELLEALPAALVRQARRRVRTLPCSRPARRADAGPRARLEPECTQESSQECSPARAPFVVTVAAGGAPAADVADAADEADAAAAVAAGAAVANIVAAATFATAAHSPLVAHPVQTCDLVEAATVAQAHAVATVGEMVQHLKLLAEGLVFVRAVKMELCLAAIAQRNQRSIRWVADHAQNAKLLEHARLHCCCPPAAADGMVCSWMGRHETGHSG
jgi:hypothetical protein